MTNRRSTTTDLLSLQAAMLEAGQKIEAEYLLQIVGDYTEEHGPNSGQLLIIFDRLVSRFPYTQRFVDALLFDSNN